MPDLRLQSPESAQRGSLRALQNNKADMPLLRPDQISHSVMSAVERGAEVRPKTGFCANGTPRVPIPKPDLRAPLERRAQIWK